MIDDFCQEWKQFDAVVQLQNVTGLRLGWMNRITVCFLFPTHTQHWFLSQNDHSRSIILIEFFLQLWQASHEQVSKWTLSSDLAVRLTNYHFKTNPRTFQTLNEVVFVAKSNQISAIVIADMNIVVSVCCKSRRRPTGHLVVLYIFAGFSLIKLF